MTLTEYTGLIATALHGRPELFNAWVTAELSDVRTSGGHCYMELIEKNAAGQTVAKLRATIWRSVAGQIFTKFRNATGRLPESGLKVMLRGSASYHPVFGLSLNISDIDPTYTLGDLERLRKEILARLTAEGVADANRRLPFPEAPQRIAVISASGAAGYGDFIHQLEGNSAGYVFYPFLFEAVMQGDRTAGSVMDALDLIEQTIDLWDCAVIIRGGGATSDLNGFDNLDLARRVATFPLPIAVGIGHERDRTVLDELACVRCKTPTAVAAFLIDTLHSAWSRASELAMQAATTSSAIIEGEKRRLAGNAATIPAAAMSQLSRQDMQLRLLARSISAGASRLTTAGAERLDGLARLLANANANAIHRGTVRLDDISSRLATAASTALLSATRRLDNANSLIEALSPANTLRRGYSITRMNGKAVRDASTIEAGTELETVLAEGIIRSVAR